MRRRWRLVAWVGLTALLVIAVSRLPLSIVVSDVAHANSAWLVAAAIANLSIVVITALQWRSFLPASTKVRLRSLVGVISVVSSVSNSGPVMLGYAAAIRLLRCRMGVGTSTAVTVLALEQIADSLAKLMIVGVVLALGAPMAFQSGAWAVLLLLSGALLTAALAYTTLNATWSRDHPWSVVIRAEITRSLDHIRGLNRRGTVVFVVALGIAKRAAESAAILAVATALELHIPLWAVVAIPIATNIALSVAPVPAGIGAYEAAAFLVLRSAGLDAANATAVAVMAHLVYLATLVGSGWLVETFAVGRRLSRSRLVLVVVALIGIAVHLNFALAGDAFDADQGMILLMARHFAHGEWSVYLWQQNYMVALEPLLLAPFARFDLATPQVAGVVGLVITAMLATLSVRLALRFGGISSMAALCWAVPPALVVHHHVALYGARLAATLIAVFAFSWSLRASTRNAWIAIGALTGFAYLSDHVMIAWTLPLVFVATQRGAIRSFTYGAVPLVVLDAVLASKVNAFHLSGPNLPLDWVRNIPQLLGQNLPQIAGLLFSRGPSPDWTVPASLLPPGWLWLLFAIPGGITGLLLLRSVTPSATRLRSLSGHDTEKIALALVVFSHLLLFLLVGGRGERWPARYLVPMWPAVSVIAAIATARWSERRRPLAALALLPALFTLTADPTWPRRLDARAATAEAQAVGQAVAQTGVSAVWAEYWDVYRMAAILGEYPRWVTYRVIERRPDWTAEARLATPVAYLVRDGDRQMLDALRLAASDTNRLRSQRTVGQFQVIVMDHSVPGLEYRNPSPSHLKQKLAAFGATLLFLGVLAVVSRVPVLSPEVASGISRVPTIDSTVGRFGHP